MTTHKMTKGYLYYETVYANKDNKELQELHQEWSHKESIKEVYILIQDDELNYLNTTGFINVNEVEVFTDKEEAIEELNELND